MVHRFLAAVFVVVTAFASFTLAATFDGLPSGATYSVGAQISDAGLQFDVVKGLFGSSAANLHVHTVGSFTYNPSFSGNYLNLPNNVGVMVILPTGASAINFDFWRGHPSAELWINGGRLSLSSIPSTVNGVTVTHLLGVKPPANTWGSIHASGTINSFAVIGTELLVDNFTANVMTGLAGDYNRNQAVDAADYVVWRKQMNTASTYYSWRSNFNATTPGSGSSFDGVHSIPEPPFLAVVSLVAGLPLWRLRRIVSRTS
jgi:hypothetical protein